nr:diguanylate cyclase [Legionella yabuuchiae]
MNEFLHKTLKLIGSGLRVEFSGLWLIEENRLRCVDTWYEKNKLLIEFNKNIYKHAFKFGEGFPGVVWKTKKAYCIPNYSDDPAYLRSRYAKEAGLNSVMGIPISYQNKIFAILEFFCQDTRQPDAELLTMMDDISKTIGKFIVHTNAMEQIQRISHYDLLTELLNRPALEDELNSLIEKEKTKSIGAVVIDIDRFKLINEALGHEFGDKILKSVATRLIESMADGKIGIGRLGTDKFILYFPDATRQNTFEYAQTIQRIFKAPFQVDQDTMHLTVCIGIATYPKDGLDSKSLIINADLAVANAKQERGNRIGFFTKELPFYASEAIAMVADLREAIKSENQFILEYQPQVDLKTGDICAVEALVRWQHPTKGLMYPDKFIPFAEKNNLIIPLNEHILYMVFQQISLRKLKTPVSINISAQQFEDGFHLVEFLESMRKEFTVNTKQIELDDIGADFWTKKRYF